MGKQIINITKSYRRHTQSRSKVCQSLERYESLGSESSKVPKKLPGLQKNMFIGSKMSSTSKLKHKPDPSILPSFSCTNRNNTRKSDREISSNGYSTNVQNKTQG